MSFSQRIVCADMITNNPKRINIFVLSQMYEELVTRTKKIRNIVVKSEAAEENSTVRKFLFLKIKR